MKRAMIAIWIDDCEDTDEAMVYVSLFKRLAERTAVVFGKPMTVAGRVEDSVESERPTLALTGTEN